MLTATATPSVAAPAPRLRGVFHEGLLVLLPPAVIVLVAVAPAGARVPAAIYGISLLACIAVSTLYHRVHWSPVAKGRMGKLDHGTIYLLIAGTFTPVSVLALSPPLRTITEICVWGGAAVGITMSLRSGWPTALEVAPYLITPAVGWVDIPYLFHSIGAAPTVLIVVGGVLYVVGALIYARHWPNPWPRTFGFHEIFHICTVAAAVCHFIAVIGWVDPLAG